MNNHDYISYLNSLSFFKKMLINKVIDEKEYLLAEEHLAKSIVSKWVIYTIVLDAVKCVFQTYVETLKKEESFDKDAQLIALNKAKDIVLAQLSEDIKEYISKNFGDVDTWINTQIEASINTLKNASTKA